MKKLLNLTKTFYKFNEKLRDTGFNHFTNMSSLLCEL